jgi:hypothetical protein
MRFTYDPEADATAMHLVYSAHARRRMAQRGLSETDVESVVAHPYRTVRSRRSGNLIYFGRVAGEDVAVVVVPGTVPLRVVTLWST